MIDALTATLGSQPAQRALPCVADMIGKLLQGTASPQNSKKLIVDPQMPSYALRAIPYNSL